MGQPREAPARRSQCWHTAAQEGQRRRDAHLARELQERQRRGRAGGKDGQRKVVGLRRACQRSAALTHTKLRHRFTAWRHHDGLWLDVDVQRAIDRGCLQPYCPRCLPPVAQPHQHLPPPRSERKQQPIRRLDPEGHVRRRMRCAGLRGASGSYGCACSYHEGRIQAQGRARRCFDHQPRCSPPAGEQYQLVWGETAPCRVQSLDGETHSYGSRSIVPEPQLCLICLSARRDSQNDLRCLDADVWRHALPSGGPLAGPCPAGDAISCAGPGLSGRHVCARSATPCHSFPL